MAATLCADSWSSIISSVKIRDHVCFPKSKANMTFFLTSLFHKHFFAIYDIYSGRKVFEVRVNFHTLEGINLPHR